ncbi:hypothetical protein F3087_34020 [Nocardia colli]|uniref:Uncharacterized protein n=1 Tax=Nocardia colli TaxID=2545717 RepID=A0A5N0E5I1_9NOCA|nr:hypothetical protein [Nocardia colli]KAA8884243.1 hypothetical protein F3087_34020 [Nocardia colli]
MAKAVTFGGVVLSVACFFVLRGAGMSFGHIGKIMELAGTGITVIGLGIAWEKAAKRLAASWQAFIDHARGWQARILGRTTVTTIQASDTITVTDTATVLKQDGFPATAVIDEKVYRLLDAVNEIRRDLHTTEQRMTAIAAAPRLTQADVDAAVANALAGFKSDLEIHAVKDLTVAICGVLTTMAGLILGAV